MALGPTACGPGSFSTALGRVTAPLADGHLKKFGATTLSVPPDELDRLVAANAVTGTAIALRWHTLVATASRALVLKLTNCGANSRGRAQVARRAPGAPGRSVPGLVAPSGCMFVTPNVRQGVLPRMLQEILDTRVMVKKALKRHKDNRVSSRAHFWLRGRLRPCSPAHRPC